MSLKNGLNRIIDDRGHLGPFPIVRKAVRVYGEQDWPQIHALLQTWEAAGYLSIVANPETANDDDVCIEMHYYIDNEGGWPQLMKPT